MKCHFLQKQKTRHHVSKLLPRKTTGTLGFFRLSNLSSLNLVFKVVVVSEHCLLQYVTVEGFSRKTKFQLMRQIEVGVKF